MTARQLPDYILNRVLAQVTRAAATAERCPQNHELGSCGGEAIRALARSGKLKIEISGRNWRQVTIMAGPNAGAKTAPDPTGMQVWRVIDSTGSRINGETYNPNAARQRRLERAARAQALGAAA